MSLRLYDTATRTIRDFVPLEAHRVGLYVCGATPQAAPHVGHLRSGVIYDLLIRWLRRSGYEVTFARNVTDIDDKILRVGAQEGVPWFAVAEANQRIFTQAYDLLGCLPPTVEPRATGHVPEMIVLMRRLIEAGHAYASGGDVYFDVRSWADQYGVLSNQKLANMRPAGDAEEELKRDPRDFALWKSAKPGEPSWETPWGEGRPGWHLECSAMATRYLGPRFDIHGGGMDLIFPHHENERAQSQAAGDPFARYWLHNGLLTVDGEKMSKTLGNVVLLTDLLAHARPAEIRYYLASAHYRSLMDHTDTSLAEAVSAYQRIEGFAVRAAEMVGSAGPDVVPLPDAFVAAMNDDLGVPQGLALVHENVREGNNALATEDREAVYRRLAAVRAMTGMLGLDPLDAHWSTAGDDDLRSVVGALVSVVLQQREAARDRKDYAAADAIRDGLTTAGVVVEDTPQGPRWELKKP